MHKFDNASEESKGQIRSWKNALPATMRRTGKLVVAVGLAGVIMTTSACSGTSEVNTPVSPSATAASEIKSSVAGTVVNGIPTKPELAFDGKNYYVQTTIADDDPAMTYDRNITTDIARNLYTHEELADGQVFATKFVAEEVLDSTLNDNPTDKGTIEKWFAKNKENIDPEQHQSFVTALNEPPNGENEFLIRGDYRAGAYQLASGADQLRVLSRTITPTAIRADTIDGKPYVEYEAKVRVAYNAKINGLNSTETVDAKVQTTLRKDPTSGKWVIAGANNVFTPTTAK